MPLTTVERDLTATEYADRVVLHHNLHRANHSSVNVTWGQDLANTAQKIAASCVFAHNTYVFRCLLRQSSVRA